MSFIRNRSLLERLNHTGSLYRITTVGQINRLLSPNGLLSFPAALQPRDPANSKPSVYPGNMAPTKIRQRFHKNFVDRDGAKRDLWEYSTGWFLNPRNPVMYQVFYRAAGVSIRRTKGMLVDIYDYEPDQPVDHIAVLEVRPEFTGENALNYDDCLRRCGVVITDGAANSERTRFHEVNALTGGYRGVSSTVKTTPIREIREGLQNTPDAPEKFWWTEWDDSKRRLLSEVLIPYKGGKYDTTGTAYRRGVYMDLRVMGIYLAPPPRGSQSWEETMSMPRNVVIERKEEQRPIIRRAVTIPSSLIAQNRVKRALRENIQDNRRRLVHLNPQFFFLPETVSGINDRITIASGDPFFTRCDVLAISTWTLLENLEVRLAHATKLRYPDVLLKWHELLENHQTGPPQSFLYKRFDDTNPKKSLLPALGILPLHSQATVFNSLVEYLECGAWGLGTLPNPSNKGILFVNLNRDPREEITAQHVSNALAWMVKNADKVFGKEGIDSLALTSFGCRPKDGALKWDDIKEEMIETAKKLTGTWDFEGGTMGTGRVARGFGVGSDEGRDLKKNPYVKHVEIWVPQAKYAESMGSLAPEDHRASYYEKIVKPKEDKPKMSSGGESDVNMGDGENKVGEDKKMQEDPEWYKKRFETADQIKTEIGEIMYDQVTKMLEKFTGEEEKFTGQEEKDTGEEEQEVEGDVKPQ